MVEAIKTFFTETVGPYWSVFFCSMIPIIELRGAIPMGAALGLPWWQSYLLSIVGNMIPVPIILLFIEKVIAWMAKSKLKFFSKLGNWISNKAEKNRGRIEKYSFWGVALFVGIPLPMTGAWTGSLVAATIKMNFWRALLSALIGVLAAGCVMTLASYGALAVFKSLA